MRIRVPTATALQMVRAIPHPICQEGLPKYWHIDAHGNIAIQSVYWLGCWAWTGKDSGDAAREARLAFDAIMPFTFAAFKAHVPHKTARVNRYRTNSFDGPSLGDLLNGN